MDPTPTLIWPRATTESSAVPSLTFHTGNGNVDKLLNLIADPFNAQVGTAAVLSALGVSLGAAVLIAAVFCFLRPLNNVVYAPRSKYADAKHTPPQVGKGLFDWIKPVITTKEEQMVAMVGLDAALFMRFTRMCRNIFVILTVIGCAVLIPVNLIAGHAETKSFSDITILQRFTPQYMYGSSSFWAYVVLAYIFDGVICYFLWYNYRAVVRLRRAYFQSPEYQTSLHARTLLVTEIPKNMRSDEGIVRLAEEAKSTGDAPRAAIARNVKDLPDLIEEHENAVKELEGHLAKYLKDPNKLPPKRPTCKAHKADKAYRKGQKVDAIEYLTSRIRELEIEVKEVRESIDKRNAMNYGFASYGSIVDAHGVAYAARKKAPQGTVMRMAPKPNDLIWKNLPMTTKQRNWQNFINNLWVALLTFFWIVPNILTAVFLSDLANLGALWPAFNTSLKAHPNWWGVVQGVAAPALTSIWYFFLPSIFRKLSIKAGDVTKTSRERHVMHKLFAFFVFNNLLVYSLFSTIWRYITAVIASRREGESIWHSIEDGEFLTLVMVTLPTVSTYWLTWLLQRNLGAAIDLAQLVNLAWGSFSRRFLSPTPRQLIEFSAPQPFDYASYYNYFLFYSTVTLCFAMLQPLVLAVTAFYFCMDSYLKKYLIMYVFITKYESGGQFWRVLFNRMLLNVLLGNAVTALIVIAQGRSWIMLASLGPLPFLILAFKVYCARAFDTQCQYYSKGIGTDSEIAIGSEVKTKRHDRVGVRFGHPVLYKPLITPMVHARAQHMLRTIYTGRTSFDGDNQSVAGYSDVYMDPMQRNQPGKAAVPPPAAPFEIVSENQLDFEHYKNRPEFRDELGGDGELYGHATDALGRRGSGSSMATTTTLLGGQRQARSRSQDSNESDRTHVGDGVVYPPGYNKPSALRDQSPADSIRSVDMSAMRGRPRDESTDSQRNALLSDASRMGRSSAPAPTLPGLRFDRSASNGFERVPMDETPGEEETSYEYFRRGRGVS